MRAEEGVKFLSALKYSKKLDEQGIETAIDIAAKYSPSSSFKRATLWWRVTGGNHMACRVFAKGVRWLAMIRRDSGQAAFEAVAAELRA